MLHLDADQTENCARAGHATGSPLPHTAFIFLLNLFILTGE